jgi:hypothetical protein
MCDRCGTKVDAFKGLRLYRLPRILTLQLKRFDYDWCTMRRVKLNNRVEFPQVLDMKPFLPEVRIPLTDERNFHLLRAYISASPLTVCCRKRHRRTRPTTCSPCWSIPEALRSLFQFHTAPRHS